MTSSGKLATLMGQDKDPPSSANVLAHPESVFKEKIGRTAKECTLDFPKAIEAPKGAADVIGHDENTQCRCRSGLLSALLLGTAVTSTEALKDTRDAPCLAVTTM
jgi:hypothetical protein